MQADALGRALHEGTQFGLLSGCRCHCSELMGGVGCQRTCRTSRHLAVALWKPLPPAASALLRHQTHLLRSKAGISSHDVMQTSRIRAKNIPQMA